MFEKHTYQAGQVVRAEQEIAVALFHEYTGPEHLLLSLVRGHPSCLAVVILKKLVGQDCFEKIKAGVSKLIKPGPERQITGKLLQTSRRRRIIEYALEEMEGRGHLEVTTGHLLLGCLREHDGVAAQVLSDLGLKIEDVREELGQEYKPGVEAKPEPPAYFVSPGVAPDPNEARSLADDLPPAKDLAGLGDGLLEEVYGSDVPQSFFGGKTATKSTAPVEVPVESQQDVCVRKAMGHLGKIPADVSPLAHALAANTYAALALVRALSDARTKV